MNLRNLIGFFFGRRAAIEALAKERGTLWLGLFFVLTAGVAREYDQEWAFHWILPYFLPLILSSVLGLLFFVFAEAAYVREVPGALVRHMRVFFSMFWLTAPLAWLYAIPVEHFASMRAAIIVNTALLAVVSVWRVVLFARVLSVLLKVSWLLIVCNILFGGGVLMFIGSLGRTMSLVDVMGGMLHTPDVKLKLWILDKVMVAAGTAAFVGFVSLFFIPRCDRNLRTYPEPERRGPFLWALVAVVTLVCAAGMLVMQPRVRNSVMIRYLDPEEAVALAERVGPDGFARTRPLRPIGRLYVNLRSALALADAMPDGEPAWYWDHVAESIRIVVHGGWNYRTHNEVDPIARYTVSNATPGWVESNREELRAFFETAGSRAAVNSNLNALVWNRLGGLGPEAGP